jgi:hypothetical protein
MPWTFAHPAAVLPLAKLPGARLSLAALSIGSMVPDFGYYVFRFEGSAFAHSFLGSLTLCPTLGAVLLLIFGVLRRPLCYLLPQPHRELLLPLANTPWRFDSSSVPWFLAALIVGAWTHILWDSFTHVDRWFVARSDWLQRETFEIRGHVLHGYSLLQYASSAVGVSVLLWAYWSWLRKAHGARPIRWFAPEDGWRYRCILAALATAVLVTLPWAWHAAASLDGSFWLRIFVVKWLVGTSSIFVVCCIAIALICYVRQAGAGTAH